MRKIKGVLRLKSELGLGQRQIARSCSISQSTAHNYLNRAAAAGLGWPLPGEARGFGSGKTVVRYFKNERFGFSVTYYEGNRPRQYYADFIIVAREADGREVMWIAETKGEVRPNTALKSKAARSWCEKISRTGYGTWQYIFVPQREFDRAGTATAEALAELAKRLTDRGLPRALALG